MESDSPLSPRLREHLARLFPTFEVTAIEPLAPDGGASRGATTKAAGYGLPVRILMKGVGGESRQVVWRVASANEFGHDRRADRAANMLLAFDDFRRAPRHIGAIDVGTIGRDGELISIREGGEFYLITDYAPGEIYADDLRRIARGQVATDLDLTRAGALAQFLAELHVPIADPLRYRRAIRDLVGHGEGIYGIVDGYPVDVPGAPSERLQALERSCATWRWQLRGREQRLVRTHGDFHPFNVVFEDGVRFTLLDASRGGCGEPADDVAAMAINYVLFALDAPGGWQRGLGAIWRRFWETYAGARSDDGLLACTPPFFAWRALVVCNPRFYPDLSYHGRDALLGLAERGLDAHCFDPAWADELFS